MSWLREVPEHWEVKRNKLVLREVNERSQDGSGELLTVSQYTGITRRRERLSDEGDLLTNAASLIGYKRVTRGDLVINIMLAWNGSLGVSPVDGIASPAYCVFRAETCVEPRFLHYLFRTQLFTGVFKTVSTGVVDSRLRLYPDVLFRLPSLLPSPPEQAAIVRFLAHTDRCIQRHILIKQKLIKLLEEQKQAIIHRAVAYGLDPNVRVKPSGVEYLGDVPEHWEVLALRYLATKFGSGITPRGGATVYRDTGVPFLRSQNVHFDGLRLEDVARIAPDLHQVLGGTHIRPGDVLLNITGASIGRVCAIPDDFLEGNVNQHVCIIRPKRSRVLPGFLAAFLATPFMQCEIRLEQSGASREGLTLHSIRSFKIAVPTTSEQQRILVHIREQTSKLVATAAIAHREISLLREYRTRLIADVVTGKLDVREAAARLPDETEEPEPLMDMEVPMEGNESGDDLDFDALNEAEA